MAVAVFTLQLNYDILPGLVTIGKYDGSHYCITAATVGDKVCLKKFAGKNLKGAMPHDLLDVGFFV